MATTLETAARTLAHYIRLHCDDQGELEDVIAAFREADVELADLRRTVNAAVTVVASD